jgi:hypothetical protein
MECASQLELSPGAVAPADESPGRFHSLGNRDRFERGDYPISEDTLVQSQQWKIRLNFMRCQPGPVNPQGIFQVMVEVIHCRLTFSRQFGSCTLRNVCQVPIWGGTSAGTLAAAIYQRLMPNLSSCSDIVRSKFVSSHWQEDFKTGKLKTRK